MKRGSQLQGPKDNTRAFFRASFIIGAAAILSSVVLDTVILRQLSVFNTTIGVWLMLTQFLGDSFLLLILVVAGSFISRAVQRRSGRIWQWIVYYVLLGLGAFGVIGDGINFGLSTDVRFATLLNKSGIDYLNLHYLGGATIYTLFILTALFMLSDPRVSYAVGDDGQRHLYMHSKLLGLIRLLRRSNLGQFFQGRRRRRWIEPTPPPSGPKQVEWDIGQSPDHSVISKEGKIRWNDRFRVSSPWFISWTVVKFLLGLAVAGALADNTALRFLTVQNYLVQTNSTWVAQLGNYFSTLTMRLSGAYTVSPGFAINNTFTFEVYSFIELLLGVAFILIGIRLGIAAVANIIVGASKMAFGMSRLAISNILLILLLPMIYFFLGSGAWVYDVGTSLNVWALFMLLMGTAFLTALTRTRRIFTIRNINRTRAIIILAIVIVGIISMPVYGAFLRGQSGKYLDYQWTPAYVPTIDYTRWAYSVDNISSADVSLITSGNTNQTLSDIRIFTQGAAKLNLRPLVGVNWMSIDNASVDIIFINGVEYWVSALQLVRPTVSNDPDIWRTEHLLITHSEKILAVNAATTQSVDIGTVWNLTQTPQLYYGQGGLWSSVDEVYLNIPKFNETHLSNYVGPPSYNGKPDYTYTGFWRYWKFFWQGRLDFANGDYGNVKALVDRDVDSRISRLLLPGMSVDPDPYPVVDDKGNIFLLHWLWVDWKSPHDFADYPDHQDTSILRLFAAVLTNLKTGEIQGYLYNQRPADYVTSFYRSMYPQWNQQIPSWLTPQLRYPEGYFNIQQSVYNFYFQTNPLQWQRNAFLQSTEETRFIITPINGVLTWAAVRLVETYQSPSKNLAGLYIAPAGKDTGKVYLIQFPGNTTIIGPESAISAVTTDPRVGGQITLHPGWTSGNILMYSINGRLTYIIPYYGTQQNLNVPVMVAAVDGATKKVGSFLISNPNIYSDVNNAAGFAVNNIGLGNQIRITGNVTYTVKYDVGGNTRWNIGVMTRTGTVEVYAHAETLAPADVTKIDRLVTGAPVSVLVDSTSLVIQQVLVP